jgi:hypothetical protein
MGQGDQICGHQGGVICATIATGVVAPLVALVFGFPTSATVSIAGFALVCGTWLFLGVALHFLARRVLQRLQP